MGLLVVTKIYLLCLSAFVAGFIIASWMHFSSGGYVRTVVYNVVEENSMQQMTTNTTRNGTKFNHGTQKKETITLQKSITDTKAEEETFQNIRILCWVLTSPANLMNKAVHVRDTWGRRCNVTLFMSTEKNASFPAIGLPVTEGYKFLWGKTREAFRHIYNNHLNDADWFLKADDDTYVIVDNLRYFLSDKNTSDPVFYGHNFNQLNVEYMSGGGGYVLSKAALTRFMSVIDNNKLCTNHTNNKAEDLMIGKCLKNAGVKAGNSRDTRNRIRFLPVGLQWFLNKGTLPKWYWQITPTKTTEGEDCCSEYLIAFHYISPFNMRNLEFLIYHLRVAERTTRDVGRRT